MLEPGLEPRGYTELASVLDSWDYYSAAEQFGYQLSFIHFSRSSKGQYANPIFKHFLKPLLPIIKRTGFAYQ